MHLRLLALLLLAALAWACSGSATAPTSTPPGRFEGTFDSGIGIRGRTEAPPPLPPGMLAVSEYAVFEIEHPGTGGSIMMTATQAIPAGTTVTWFTFAEGSGWSEVGPGEVAENAAGGSVDITGEFDVLPTTLIALIDDSNPPPTETPAAEPTPEPAPETAAQ